MKKVSKQHRWYLENTSCDRESCWKEKILLSARGFSVFFQMLVKAQKVGRKVSLLGLEPLSCFGLEIRLSPFSGKLGFLKMSHFLFVKWPNDSTLAFPTS